jgi:hypothetical protein
MGLSKHDSHIFAFALSQIPFDQIMDCDIVEPAGNTCICIVNTLHYVHVDTASSPRQNGEHELTIVGLQNPVGFKKVVWAMKRASLPATSRNALDRGLEAVAPDEGSNPSTSEDVTTLLRDIRDDATTQ